jgi:hypothetical protein
VLPPGTRALPSDRVILEKPVYRRMGFSKSIAAERYFSQHLLPSLQKFAGFTMT